ncbi:fatty acid cis/trans isomerase [Pseudomaricurvus alcaniphilus]|uniref:fatty acid cis/trans isomerase n=1 Tax=Pseudomaricurvus alcaniphilus TaxID=1166482 RepID=UPI00140B67A5|nr:fatty acid cis/trans isomerase [Pseudomaricurvus alcaniphilus]NHN38467.1 fatty acid cis/trans isomerase [Pseudomaricurvus alcaniphilus]
MPKYPFVSASVKIPSLLLLFITVAACATLGAQELNEHYGKAQVQARLHKADSAAGEFFFDQVKPILDSRCISCHACYDAPCQLKLNSSAGIDRGITDVPVYSGKRLIAAQPTRLFTDQQTTEQWRAQGFYPVLNERQQTPEANRSASLLYQVLQLKQQHPLPQRAVLNPAKFDFSLKRENHCPAVENFADYASDNPMAGMPYGLPGLSAEEMQTMTRWIEDGAPLGDLPPLSAGHQQQIDNWEAFLNQDSAKAQLVARYIYEHLFLANLYFNDLADTPDSRVYFKLVRSATPPGQPIEVIATRRPGDNPGVKQPYYRLQRHSATIVTKTHLPYALGKERMTWLQQLFFEPDYSVARLPGYEPENLNPFKTFRDIPAASRYRFLLEESHYFIAGFIKGPVCRGPVAVDVINDHFWVFFVNPDATVLPMLDGFLEQQTKNLRLPGIEGSNAGVLSYWTTYSKLHRQYLLAKADGLKQVFKDNPIDLDLIWDGDSHNPNAALTVFRNYDDAAVVKGLVGNAPKTAWVIDYPLLERIHYLLTADFDVYGNVGHQLNTRLYMDFLRIEGEYNFLKLLPPKERVRLRDFWYRDASSRLHDQLYSYKIDEIGKPDIPYSSANPKEELYKWLRYRLRAVLDQNYTLDNPAVTEPQRKALQRLQEVQGTPASLLSESTILLVEGDNGADKLYTVLANRAHLNITSLLFEQDNRLPQEDSIAVTYGISVDYPNTFLRVREQQLPELVAAIAELQTEKDYRRLLDRFGVRRSNPDFWQHSDRVQALYRRQQPYLAGWMDYNRLENR